MAMLLSVVDDVFQLSGRPSVVVAPGIPRSGNWHLQIGDALTLRLPDGSRRTTVVGGIETLSPPNPTWIPLMLGPGISPKDVPAGTEIWVD
jgi:hypothetical protein